MTAPGSRLRRLKEQVIRYVLPALPTFGKGVVGIGKASFDADGYRRSNPDVAATGIDPYYHFLHYGRAEGRRGRFFDNEWYFNRYPDLNKAVRDGFEHYQTYGRVEGRAAQFIIVSTDSDSTYRDWISTREVAMSRFVAPRAHLPRLSVLMAVFNPDLQHLKEAIQSVRGQLYDNWELCIADDASTNPAVRPLLERFRDADPRIKVEYRAHNGHISEASNTALALATGEYVGVLDHDDALSFDALQHVAAAIAAHPKAEVFYSDEDKIDDCGTRYSPFFKGNFNPEFMLAQNMVSHFGVYRTHTLRRLSGFRSRFDGAQDYDLALRMLGAYGSDAFHHIPRVLYHWRASIGSTALSIDTKPYAVAAGRLAIEDYLANRHIEALVEAAPLEPHHYRVRYALRDQLNTVAVIAEVYDMSDIERLKTTLLGQSIADLLIVAAPDCHAAVVAGWNDLQWPRAIQPRILDPIEARNRAAEMAQGDLVCFMDAGLVPQDRHWLEELLAFAQQGDIGCVGAKICHSDGSLYHGGYLLGVCGIAGHAHRGLPPGKTGYFGRAAHHQAVSAVSSDCLMVDKAAFLAAKGFDPETGQYADIDLCLKLSANGLRTVWNPYAQLTWAEEPRSRTLIPSAAKVMKMRWHSLLQGDPAYNPNLTRDREDFSLIGSQSALTE